MINWPAVLITTTDRGTLLYSLKIAPPWECLETQTYSLGKNDLKVLLSLRSGTLCDEVPAQEQKSFMEVLTRFGLSRETDAAHLPSTLGSSSNAIAIPAVNEAQVYSLKWPIMWEVTQEGFICRDHNGVAGATVSAEAVNLAKNFLIPTSFDGLESDLDSDGVRHALRGYFAELETAGLLEPIGDPKPTRDSGEMASSKSTIFTYHARFTQRLEELRKIHEAGQPAGSERIKIHLVLTNWWTPPLALGMIMSHARVWNAGKLDRSYDLFPRWVAPYQNVTTFGGGPSVFLFSDYIWSHDINLELSRRIKAAYPNAIIIHGGPDCPSYREDAERYFSDHPYVDIAVRGEGEETICEILDALAPGLLAEKIDLNALAPVSGLSYRSDDGEVVLTASRPRISDLNVIPSPFLDGTFDVFESDDEIRYWQLNSVEREELDADLHATALLHSLNALTLRSR
jgi:hypothetical protein